jgi:hypothetical protein
MDSLTYLKNGSLRQQTTYDTLAHLNIFDVLAAYDPVLAGTIPLGIDVATSDLDIICYADDLEMFAAEVRKLYGDYPAFSQWQREIRGEASRVAIFSAGDFTVEIFAQNRPTGEQYAVRHMQVEARLLKIAGDAARQAIRKLKSGGVKTEPAFAAYFKLTGHGLSDDPYEALLELETWDDEALQTLIPAEKDITE